MKTALVGYGRQWYHRSISFLLVLAMVIFCPFAADAAKKKKGGGDAELEKALEPIGKSVVLLLGKVQGRALFSPKDYNDLEDMKFKLLDLMKDNPTNPVLARPVYQTAIIYSMRDQFTDAYELFGFLMANFPDNPYGLKSKSEIQHLKKQLGEEYFAGIEIPAAGAPASGKK